MTTVQLILLVIWILVVVVWAVYAYLNYKQVRIVLGLRPGIKLFFVGQAVLALLFFTLALLSLFLLPSLVTTSIL